MALVGDIFQLVTRTSSVSTGTIGYNVWFYRLTALGTNPNNTLVTNFEVNIIPNIQANMATTASVVGLREKNLFNPLEFVDKEYAAGVNPGYRAGAECTGVLAAEYRAPRGRTDMRNGYKRISHVTETDVEGNFFTAAMITNMNSIAANFNVTLAAGGNTFIPVIVKRVKYTTSEGKEAYRLPENQGEAVWYQAVWAAETSVRTQVSRRVPAS